MSNKEKKKTPVRILNPADGCGFTNFKRAEQYVEHGRGILLKDEKGRWTLEFIESDARHARALSVVDIGYDRASNDGLASIPELRHFPIAGDPIRVLMNRSRKTRRAA